MDRAFYGRMLLIAVMAGAAAACGSSTPTTPTTTTPNTLTDTFSGNLTQNGAVTNSFATKASGSVQATLSTLAPDSSVVIGMSVGTWNGSACTIVIANDAATQGTTVSGSASSAGNFCVRVYDVGKLTQTIQYTVTVTHP